jgi:hypothetical protein
LCGIVWRIKDSVFLSDSNVEAFNKDVGCGPAREVLIEIATMAGWRQLSRAHASATAIISPARWRRARSPVRVG